MKEKWTRIWNELWLLAVEHPELVEYAVRVTAFVYRMLN